MRINAFFQVFWANIHNFFKVQGNVKVSHQYETEWPPVVELLHFTGGTKTDYVMFGPV